MFLLGGIYDTDRDTYLDLSKITRYNFVTAGVTNLRPNGTLNWEVLVVITNLVLTEMLFPMTHKTAQVYKIQWNWLYRN